jgi:hypothetical protein
MINVRYTIQKFYTERIEFTEKTLLLYVYIWCEIFWLVKLNETITWISCFISHYTSTTWYMDSCFSKLYSSTLIIYMITCITKNTSMNLGAVVVVIVWWLDLQMPMQSVPITTKDVNLNLAHGEVYSIQHYLIKFVINLWQVGGFLRVLQFPPPIKLTTAI